ncbi:hypothetical protein G0U57_016860, partial [Chelydra serpentina]
MILRVSRPLTKKWNALFRETLTNEVLEELIKSSTEDEDDDEQEEPATWTLHKFSEVFQAAKHLNDLIYDYDPSMERSLKITLSITGDLRPYQEMFRAQEKQRQLPITMFFKKKQPAATSRAEPEPTTSSMTCSLSPEPGPSCPRSTSS